MNTPMHKTTTNTARSISQKLDKSFFTGNSTVLGNGFLAVSCARWPFLNQILDEREAYYYFISLIFVTIAGGTKSAMAL